jgi:uncharacterized protein YyaL (SSP411 family)
MNTQHGRKPNRLINEKSPYLLQHAFNPVEWYPWGVEAFTKARNEQKPIFLSVGYSTCHWCHVMERESFENDSIAHLMNDYFVCIKVDREERPDVDKVYMTALQGMGQNGGWPMSMFLTPDLKPFYGGTYFPPMSQYGRIGFADLLRRIHDVWATDREKVVRSADGIIKALREVPPSLPASSLNPTLLDTCFEQFQRIFDQKFGGFGSGAKFPRPSVFNFLLRYYSRTKNPAALDMVERTLKKMAAGGIYDHIGGGFHRYSVDSEWRVPHFEKMLYDQAQIVCSYVDLFQITGNPLYAAVANETLEYVLRDLTSKEGGFFSAEDADSPKSEKPEEKGEGAFYLWTREEVLSILGGKDGEVFCYYYGIEGGGNAPFDPQQEFTGRNILYVAHSLDETAASFKIPSSNVAKLLSQGRLKLLEVRSRRARPDLDDKILTSWNGLMISAFARGFQALQNPAYLEAAERSAEFIIKNLSDPESEQLKRRYRDGDAGLEAHLDDYAFLVQGLLDLYEASFDVKWLEYALSITKTQNSLFEDANEGGFFDTSGEDSTVLVRMKEQYDGAEPTGSSIAVMNLLRLAEVTDDKGMRKRAEKALLVFGEVLQKQPVVMPQMAAAYEYSLGGRQIIVAGLKGDPATRAILDEVNARYLPDKILILLGDEDATKRLVTLNPFYESLSMNDGRPTAFICRDYVCSLPTSDVTIVGKLLDGTN